MIASVPDGVKCTPERARALAQRAPRLCVSAPGCHDVVVYIALGEGARITDAERKRLRTPSRALLLTVRRLRAWGCPPNVFEEFDLHARVRARAGGFEVLFLGYARALSPAPGDPFEAWAADPRAHICDPIPGALDGAPWVLLHDLWCDALAQTVWVYESID